MAIFVCTECGYRFESIKEKPKSCPYCSKGRVEKEKTAEELVNSAKIE